MTSPVLSGPDIDKWSPEEASSAFKPSSYENVFARSASFDAVIRKYDGSLVQDLPHPLEWIKYTRAFLDVAALFPEISKFVVQSSDFRRLRAEALRIRAVLDHLGTGRIEDKLNSDYRNLLREAITRAGRFSASRNLPSEALIFPKNALDRDAGDTGDLPKLGFLSPVLLAAPKAMVSDKERWANPANSMTGARHERRFGYSYPKGVDFAALEQMAARWKHNLHFKSGIVFADKVIIRTLWDSDYTSFWEGIDQISEYSRRIVEVGLTIEGVSNLAFSPFSWAEKNGIVSISRPGKKRISQKTLYNGGGGGSVGSHGSLGVKDSWFERIVISEVFEPLDMTFSHGAGSFQAGTRLTKENFGRYQLIAELYRARSSSVEKTLDLTPNIWLFLPSPDNRVEGRPVTSTTELFKLLHLELFQQQETARNGFFSDFLSDLRNSDSKYGGLSALEWEATASTQYLVRGLKLSLAGVGIGEDREDRALSKTIGNSLTGFPVRVFDDGAAGPTLAEFIISKAEDPFPPHVTDNIIASDIAFDDFVLRHVVNDLVESTPEKNAELVLGEALDRTAPTALSEVFSNLASYIFAFEKMFNQPTGSSF